MSQWGKLDRVEQAATATANNASSTVVLSTQRATAANGWAVGYSLVIANVDYRIDAITSANTVVLDTPFVGANVAAANIAIQQDPKDIPTNGWGSNVSIGSGANTVNKSRVYGVDRTEIGVAGNKANGFSHTGWTYYKTYTNTQGATRHKAEVLVAMSKNFNANATGTLQTDANDGSVLS